MADNATERMEILKMLSEGKISVDEAERLIQALDRSHERPTRRHGNQRHHNEGEGPDIPFSDFFNDMESRVKGFFRDLQDREIFPDFFAPFEAEEAKKPENRTIVIEPNTHVSIKMLGRSKNWWDKFRGGNIKIKGSTDKNVTLDAEEIPSVMQKENQCIIFAETKELSLNLPNDIASLSVTTAGGEVEIEEMDVPIRCKTFGGDISVSDTTHPLNLKTMGGNICIGSWKVAEGESMLISMGGNMKIKFDESSSAKIMVHSLGGKIFSELKGEPAKQKVPFMLDSYNATLGIGEAAVRIESAGGNIELT